MEWRGILCKLIRSDSIFDMQAILTQNRYLQTRFGLPKPWSPDEVQAHLAKARKELNQGWHMYNTIRRVWAQKPMDAKPAVKEPEAAVETLA